MFLRPRYSLLTLLVVTALVAGGLKWWYGPHHVVERPSSDVEVEYTYTRDWRGERIVHGPYISRNYGDDNKLHRVKINYYLNGIDTEHEQLLHAFLGLEQKRFANLIRMMRVPLPAADEERFLAAIDQEIARIKAYGFLPIITRYQEFDEQLNFYNDKRTFSNEN